MEPSEILEGLNPEQRAVVQHREGAIRVGAVAGAGKTNALVNRVAYLIAAYGVKPEEILAVTFSKRAGDEMNVRLRALGVDTRRCHIGTWHALAWQIVREESDERWEVDSKNKYRTILKEVCGYKGMKWDSADITVLTQFVTRCKSRAAAPGDQDAWKIAEEMRESAPKSAIPTLLMEAYGLAEMERRDRGLITFDDMLVDCARFLDDETIRARWSSKWDYVLQDECFVGETPILLADGTTRPIGELVEERYAGEVLTWSPSTGTVARRVTGWARRPVAKRMVRVGVRQHGFARSGKRLGPLTERVRFTTRYLVCTHDHPVWTTNRGWVSAGELAASDEVQVESVAPYVSGYANRVKHGVEGRRALSEMMAAKNERGVCGVHRGGGRITKRGGNGTGPTRHEAALAELLGEGWICGHVVRLGRSDHPRHYKLDVANPERRIAIELDGSSHAQAGRAEQDRRKDETLRVLGWEVIRVSNLESCGLTADLVAERLASCPCPASVLFVEPWTPRDPYVYDLTIEGTHAFYADGVLVHNCQDENFAQQLIAESLARRHGNYMVVGDPAQAIYGFRGSDPKGLLTFGERWGAVDVYMHRNYRSGPAILKVANAVLRSMPAETRLDMELTAERSDIEGEVRGSMHVDSEEEAETIAQEVLQNLSDGARWKDHAILYRTNAQSRTIEEAFLGERIPYVVVGGTSFYQRKEVRSLLGYLRVATERGGFDDVKRTLNAPWRFLGRKYLDRVKDAYDCGPVESGWMDAVRSAAEASGIWAKQRAAAHSYAALIDGLRVTIRKAAEVDDAHPDATLLHDDAKPAVLLREVLADTEYVKWLRRDEGAESAENDRVTNVRELIRAAGKFPNVKELLDFVDDQIRRSERAARENDDADQVLLMTIHKSKGLEWPRVFLTGAIDGVLPHGKAEDPNEERRLFYVAVTRARDSFRITCPEVATFNSQVGDCVPSRYCKEAGIDMGRGFVALAEKSKIRSRIRANPDVVATEARHAAWGAERAEKEAVG